MQNPYLAAGGGLEMHRREEFLSEGDLALRELDDEELVAWWNLWLQLAQASNDLDEATYSHGVFDRDPAVQARPPAQPDGARGR